MKRLIIFEFTYFPPWQCHSAEQEVDPECSFSLCYGLSPCPSLGPSLCFGCDVRCRDVVSAVCSSEPLMPSASEHVYGLYNELQPDSREKQKEWKEYNTFIELLTFTETCRHLHQSWDFMTLSKITLFPIYFNVLTTLTFIWIFNEVPSIHEILKASRYERYGQSALRW